ncbi:MAG: M48 family metallopeptidase [Spirochaetales bacterium]|nr:M48 family metallopeptidase [Spirochaetales bacterium]
MSPTGILTLYLVFFGVEFFFAQILTRLNIGFIKKSRGSVPKIFADFFDDDTYRKSVDYSLEKSRFGVVGSAISAIVLLVVVLTGFLGTMDMWINTVRLSQPLRGILFVGAVSMLFHILSLPVSIYTQFVIEEKHGFNKMTPKTFVVDQLKGMLLSVALGVPVLLGLFWFVRSAGQLWWIYAFAALAVFQLVLSVIYPVLIAPLFNKFTPLDEGSLKIKIEDLAQTLSFGTRGIFVMDGSRRSGHSNAYFTGFGRMKRIVLFDTLLSQLDEEQILAVLAHEIGHQKKKHILQRLGVSLAMTAAAFWLISILLESKALFTAFGFEQMSTHGLLVILSFCSGPFTFMLTPLFTMWSRHHEYQADRFAAESIGRSAEMKTALLTLGRDNLSNLTPHPLYSFFHYSHPTLAERIGFLSELEKS